MTVQAIAYERHEVEAQSVEDAIEHQLTVSSYPGGDDETQDVEDLKGERVGRVWRAGPTPALLRVTGVAEASGSVGTSSASDGRARCGSRDRRP